MQLRVEHTSTTNNTLNSLLQTLSELTLPLSVVNSIIDILRESMITCAAAIGNGACDVIENIECMSKVSEAVDNQLTRYEQLRDISRCLQYMQEYKKAAIAAGVK